MLCCSVGVSRAGREWQGGGKRDEGGREREMEIVGEMNKYKNVIYSGR